MQTIEACFSMISANLFCFSASFCSRNKRLVCNLKYMQSSEIPGGGGFPYETDRDARRLA